VSPLKIVLMHQIKMQTYVRGSDVGDLGKLLVAEDASVWGLR